MTKIRMTDTSSASGIPYAGSTRCTQKTKVVQVRMTTDMKESIESLARSLGLTQSATILHGIELARALFHAAPMPDLPGVREI